MAHFRIASCPYYAHEAWKSITCEGYFGKDTLTQIRFKTGDLKERHARVYCRNNWQKCPLAIALEQKYKVDKKWPSDQEEK